MSRKTKNAILVTLTLLIASFIPAVIFGKWLEAIIFIVCHWIIREQFKKQYHHVIPAMCRIITASVMFFGVSFILPMELSMLSAIPINYFISWIGFVKKECDDYEVKCNKLQNKLKKNPTEKLLDKCAVAKLSARDTKIAVMYYIERKTPKDIWLWICQQKEYEPIEWDTIYQLLWRIGKKINNAKDL